ncbi:MAG: glycosyl hydrolase [Gammaproteobacteria bacterium]|nr:glycosyl hydrolase [Gammaproteobacteria bacterium]
MKNSRLQHAVSVLVVAGLLAACESPLNLEGVEASESVSIRRGDLFQDAASSDQVLLVVGNHGLVMRSLDGGTTWNRQELPGWPSLIDIAACPNGRFAALATEGQVLVSADAGQTWISHAIQTEESPQGITCDPQNRLWVVGSFSTIIVSDDEGENWEDHSIGDDTILTTIQFIDAQHAMIFGEYGFSVHSADGGATWTPGAPLPDEFYPQDAWFRDLQTGWVAGLAGQILHTADGGQTWALQETGTLVPIYSLAGIDNDVYAAGGEGTVLRFDGASWQRVDHGQPVRLFLRVVHDAGDGRLLIGGAAGALYSVPRS